MIKCNEYFLISNEAFHLIKYFMRNIIEVTDLYVPLVPSHFPVHVLSCIQLFATPWTVARQAPLSTEFPRQEYWSGLSFPSPGDLPDPGVEPTSLVSPALAGRFFTTVPCEKSSHFETLENISLWSFRNEIVYWKSSGNLGKAEIFSLGTLETGGKGMLISLKAAIFY